MSNTNNINMTVRSFIQLYRNQIGSDDQCAIDLVNQGRIKAWPLHDSVGNTGIVGINITSGCIVLPASIQSIRGPRYLKQDYECCDEGYFEINPQLYKSCEGNTVVQRTGDRTPIPFIISEPEKISFRCNNAHDIGKKVAIRYIDNSGTVRTEELALEQHVRVETSYRVKECKWINKGVTHGNIWVKGKSSGSKGALHPIDGTPMHSIYHFTIGGVCCGSGCIVAEAKKRFFLYHQESLDELLDINPEALSKFISAAKADTELTSSGANASSAFTKAGREFLTVERQDEEKTIYPTRGIDYGYSTTDELASYQ